MYRLAGIRRRFRLGRYPEILLVDARNMAREALAEVARGKDPLLAKKAREANLKRERLAAKTFAQLAEQYTEWAKKNKREKTWKEYDRIISKHLNPEFGKIDAKDLSQTHVRDFLRHLAGRTPVLANRTRATLGAIYKWAIREEITGPEDNPVSGISRPGGKESSKDRNLSADEIKAVWNALENETSYVKEVLKLILLTGQRPGEVMAMRWDEIDFGEALWELPGTRTKNYKAHIVPLNAQALRILEQQRNALAALRKKRQDRGDPSLESPFVFPNRRMVKQDKAPVKMLRKMVARIIKELGISPFAPHDLRRTCATQLGKMEVPGIVISLILNHALPGITNQVYNRYGYLKEKREALDAWGAKLARIVSNMQLVQAEKTSS